MSWEDDKPIIKDTHISETDKEKITQKKETETLIKKLEKDIKIVNEENDAEF